MSLSLLLSEEAIAEKIQEVARQLNHDFTGREVTLISVLKGSILLTSDLMRQLDIPFTIEFIQAKSYGMRGTTPGELIIEGLEKLHLKNKEVLLIDDIYDTGKTLQEISQKIQEYNPKSLTTLVLLKKQRADHPAARPDYVCFDIEDHFVVGYGLDYKEKYRGLKGIYTLSP